MAKSSVDFESSTIFAEVKDIIKNSKAPSLFDYKAIVHTAKEDFSVFALTSIEGTRDYLNNVGDVKMIQFRIGLGDYIRRLYPYRENLEITIRRTPIDQTGTRPTVVVETTRYKAIFNPAHNPPVAGGEFESKDPALLNTKDLVDVQVELVDRSFEPLRIKTTGGSFRKATMEQIIRNLFGEESSKILVDGKPCIDRIDIVTPDNREVQDTVVIEHGKRLTSVPTYLQEASTGVYNRGMGTYYQKYEGKRTWFIYPTFDTERAESTSSSRLTIYPVPQDRFPMLDRSYWKDGKVLKVVITAQRTYRDGAEISFMNFGGGYRMADARSFMKKPVKMGANGPIGVRSELNHEVIMKDQEDGLNFAPVMPVSANPYKLRSSILQSSMGQIDVVWENADEDELFPGMPVNYIYLSSGKPVTLKGTLVFVHYFTSKTELHGNLAFRTLCRMTIACEQQSKKPDLPSEKSVGPETGLI